ncbi:hypothetical protein [Pseudomonas sp. NBRC 111119]|uniref:hypothetical protein n=1 Tax=Pseudomonas sp. NBRC 111119 TaxID=1661034 RepID=UPI000760DA07|nr:hypothetical protein [Pseudomonas sp. NBRC 111119]
MNITEAKRAEFETAFVKQTASMRDSRSTEYAIVLLEGMKANRTTESYQNPVAAAAWWAWNASREAVVLVIPSFDDYPTSMERDMRESLRSAIEAQGLKVAP